MHRLRVASTKLGSSRRALPCPHVCKLLWVWIAEALTSGSAQRRREHFPSRQGNFVVSALARHDALELLVGEHLAHACEAAVRIQVHHPGQLAGRLQRILKAGRLRAVTRHARGLAMRAMTSSREVPAAIWLGMAHAVRATALTSTHRLFTICAR